MKPTHIDLFSGVGGFALAARWADFNTIQFVEKDAFCQKVLRKHWAETPIHDDITTFSGEPFRGRCGLLTGGFPCQPFSVAGNGLGEEDDRHLWPEMLRVIREVRPLFVVAENVRGLVEQHEMVFECVLADLEDEGYSVGTLVIPACAVNAPHRRDRVWIVAHAASLRRNGNREVGGSVSQGEAERRLFQFAGSSETPADANGERELQPKGTIPNKRRRSGNRSKDASNAESKQSRRLQQSGVSPDAGNDCAVGNANSTGRSEQCGSLAIQSELATFERADWRFVEPLVCRGDDGLSKRLDRDRTKRLKALGNAVVPQVVYPILKAIREAIGDERT